MEYYSYKMLIVLETLLMLGLELAKKHSYMYGLQKKDKKMPPST